MGAQILLAPTGDLEDRSQAGVSLEEAQGGARGELVASHLGGL